MIRWLRRTRVVFGLVIIAVLAIARLSFFAPLRDNLRLAVAVPALALDRLGIKIHHSMTVITSINQLSSENSDLKQKLIEAEATIATLQEAKGENERLKTDLNFQETHRDLTLMSGTVINYSPSSLYQAIVINRGSKDGAKEGQAVVANGYLVGKIHQVSDHTAEVWLLSNPNLVTPVILANNQTVGLLKGSIRGLIVENIPLDTSINKGDAIVTSALEGLYPSGIAVGTVQEVISSKEDIFLTLRLSTPVNIANLTSVFIVR